MYGATIRFIPLGIVDNRIQIGGVEISGVSLTVHTKIAVIW